MQRQGRSGNANGGGGDGSGDYRRGGGGAFPDPFAGFGGFGFGGSMMQNFFGGRDPFDDPFFNRPFGSLFGGFPDNNPFDHRRHGGFLENRPFHSQQENRRGPIIEEIEDDHPHATGSSQEPIVEHPDDDVRPDRRQRVTSRHQGPLVNHRDDGGFQSYSFQSSSFSYGGPNGNYYASSTARRRGPNGVVHEEHHEKDSSSKSETHRVSRGIHDKGHSLTRKRNAEGREENLQTLHNLGEEEVPEFEKRWEFEAERNLPGWNRNRARSLAGGGNEGSRQRAALPSGSSGSSGWSGARQA
ncbi:uncharacterized protein LOC112348277 [Selaginella moellendorffii]|uniref:uncharacterized protein LOC112348277 n=1 Tax=Selaginella moellendorffii TaxID=88036 RepID=UPI000D1C9521|nr:uncharacterized protein LOC112348277 [Selaginella moellendorffii]|eukprot:XP_024536261.1 uncharacterized protein LOC112348277 [Selaginella moellendorffii]